MTPEELETLVRHQFNRMRGQLAGFIEGCGLPPRQERSIISTMKTLSYNAENTIVDQVNE